MPTIGAFFGKSLCNVVKATGKESRGWLNSKVIRQGSGYVAINGVINVSSKDIPERSAPFMSRRRFNGVASDQP